MSGSQKTQLRFAVLCDGRSLQRWQLECLAKLAAVPGVAAAAMLISGESRQRDKRGGWLFGKVLDRTRIDSQRWRCSLSGELATLPLVSLSALVDARAETRKYDLDFILCFGVVPVARALTQCARYGVWAYSFGDWEQYRGEPAGFWEVHDGTSVTGALLVRLTQDADTVVPLRRGFLRTKRLGYRQNCEHLLSRFTHWPAQVCKDIQGGVAFETTATTLTSTAPWRSPPGNWQLVVHAMQITWFAAAAGLRSLFRCDHWNIGIAQQPIADFLDPACRKPQIQWLPERRRSEFAADPFGAMQNGKLTIICEYLDYADGRGVIAAIAAGENQDLQRVLIGPQPAVHLSYPYIFQHEGQWLCIPETHQAREVALYAAEQFPHRWRKLSTLLSDLEVVDATPFRFQDYWWIAAADAGLSSPSADLFLWYARDLMGPWSAHPGNPVKTDVRSARPAGTPFIVDGVLYRPAMDCSETYGGRVVINRVERLTPNSFDEVPVAAIGPDADGPYPDGLHTLSAVGDVTLIDGKRLIFVPAEFRRTVRSVFRRLLGGR